MLKITFCIFCLRLKRSYSWAEGVVVFDRQHIAYIKVRTLANPFQLHRAMHITVLATSHQYIWFYTNGECREGRLQLGNEPHWLRGTHFAPEARQSLHCPYRPSLSIIFHPLPSLKRKGLLHRWFRAIFDWMSFSSSRMNSSVCSKRTSFCLLIQFTF